MDTSMERSANFVSRVDPGVTNTVDGRVVSLTAPASTAAEQYRVLYHRLERVRAVKPLRTLTITSAVSGEGKTLTAVNLALTAAQANPQRQVLLVDCDLRRPHVHDYLGLSATPGLGEVLAEEAQLRALLTLLAQHFDEIYLDAPPCLPYADAHVLGSQSHGVLLVVKAGATSQRWVAQALEHLQDAPVLGCVLNGVDVTDLAYR